MQAPYSHCGVWVGEHVHGGNTYECVCVRVLRVYAKCGCHLHVLSGMLVCLN